MLADLLALTVTTLALAGYRQLAGLPTRTDLLQLAATNWALIICLVFVFPHIGLRQAIVPFSAPIVLGVGRA